jgi:hypothetical protein
LSVEPLAALDDWESMRRRFLQLGTLFVPALLSCARQGAELSRWENVDTAIHIRIVERAEVGNFLNGAYYLFESRSMSENEWHHVMTFRHDDQVGIPKDSTVVKNSSIAYVFMGWMFGVTTDSGRTWSVWNAKDDLPGWSCCNYRLIRSVDLDGNGTGTMTLNPISGRAGEVPKLYTNDFGRSWTATAANTPLQPPAEKRGG